MKRVLPIVGVIVAALLFVAKIIGELLQARASVDYFAKSPSDLWWLALIVAIGTAATFGFLALPSTAQKRLMVLGWFLLASGMSAFGVFLAFNIVNGWREQPPERVGFAEVVVALVPLIIAVFAAKWWMKFREALRNSRVS